MNHRFESLTMSGRSPSRLMIETTSPTSMCSSLFGAVPGVREHRRCSSKDIPGSATKWLGEDPSPVVPTVRRPHENHYLGTGASVTVGPFAPPEGPGVPGVPMRPPQAGFGPAEGTS